MRDNDEESRILYDDAIELLLMMLMVSLSSVVDVVINRKNDEGIIKFKSMITSQRTSLKHKIKC
jgi:hypothetical protein